MRILKCQCVTQLRFRFRRQFRPDFPNSRSCPKLNLRPGGLDAPRVGTERRFLRPPAQGVKRPGLPTAHRCQKDPVTHAGRFPSQQIPAVKVPAQGDVPQIRGKGLRGVGHYQPVLCPGHGDIQHPHFLRDTLRRHFHRYCPLGKGRIADTAVRVHAGKSQAQCPVAENLRAQILLIKPPGQVAEEYHRKLQTFGFMDAHDVDAVRPGCPRRHQSPLFHSVQMLQELGKLPQSSLLKIAGILIKGLNIRGFCLSVGHRSKDAVQPGQQQALLHQSGQRASFCFRAEDSQQRQEFLRLRMFAGSQRVIESALFLLCPDPGQILRRKAKHGAGQHADKRNILPGIHNCLQKAAESADLPGLQKIRPAAGGTADPLLFQRTLKIAAGAAGRPQQDDNISGFYRAQSISVPHLCSGIQHLTNSSGHKGRLLRVGVGHGFQCVQLRAGVRQRNVGHALPESLRFRIIKPAHLRRHAAGKYVVDALDDLPAGTEIVTEQYLSSLPRFRLFRRCVSRVFFKKYPGVCQPELIDGLLDVAHQETILLFQAQCGEDRILHTVGILILVHQNFPVSSADFRRGSRGICTGFAKQKVKGMVLQIAEIQDPAAALGSTVVPVKLFHQPGKAPGTGSRLGQIH